MVTTITCLYTIVMSMSSAIYTTSEQGAIEEIRRWQDRGRPRPMSLFVLGYGTGPSHFSPLSELPAMDYNPVYIATMLLYTIISVPTALVRNDPGLMVLRLLQGFFSSPCLTPGVASVGAMDSPPQPSVRSSSLEV